MVTKAQLQELARIGAELRLREIDAERELIYSEFPALAPRKMSLEVRRAASARMKASWAARRKH